MKIKSFNVFLAIITMIGCTWLFSNSQNEVSLELSIFCSKLVMTMCALWICMDNSK